MSAEPPQAHDRSFFSRTVGGRGTAPAQRALALALALGARGEFERLEALYAEALDAAGQPLLADLHEGALMVHLFGGFPRAIEAITVLADAAAARALPWPAAGRAVPKTTRARRGGAVFEAIYGEKAGAVRARLESLHPALAEAILEDAYGRILARPALEPRTRELMAVCALAALALQRQLHSHLRGALRLGASVAELHEMITLARHVAGTEVTEPARVLLARVTEAGAPDEADAGGATGEPGESGGGAARADRPSPTTPRRARGRRKRNTT